jgi:hypothetical protein
MLRVYRPGEWIPLAEARLLLRGRGGRPPSLTTVYRWAKAGCRPRADLPAVVLRTQYLGPDLGTRREWIEEFEKLRDQLHLKEVI